MENALFRGGFPLRRESRGQVYPVRGFIPSLLRCQSLHFLTSMGCAPVPEQIIPCLPRETLSYPAPEPLLQETGP